ncbi:MAG: hypothetical protein J6333_01220, partial [Planctomycetes bacterium]|nr:hypothetical protein [Planctomycetota bacterium]
TLIEMLVVVAIVAVLAALLAPSLQKALQRAKGVACMGGPVKKLGAMLAMYASDYDDMIPPTCNYGGKTQKWFMAFWNAGYIVNGREVWCPVTPFVTWQSGRNYYKFNNDSDAQAFGSMATAVYRGDDGDYRFSEYYRFNKLKRPGKQIFLGDASLNVNHPIDTPNNGHYIIRPSMQDTGPQSANGKQGRIDARHANCAALVNFGGNAELFQFFDREQPWLPPPFGRPASPEYYQRCTNKP